MEKIAVYCSWADEQISRSSDLQKRLPKKLAARIQAEVGSQYLDALAAAFLVPNCTEELFRFYEPVAVDIFSRLCFDRDQDVAAVLAAVARILPFASYLKPFLIASLNSRHRGPLEYLSKTRGADLINLPEDSLALLLIAVFRLFSHDLETFKHFVTPTQIFSLFKHGSDVVKYLAIRCFSRYMRFADAKTESLLEKYLSIGAVLGEWEGQAIDYRYLSLWEERRWSSLECSLDMTRAQRTSKTAAGRHHFITSSLAPQTALLGDILVPRQPGDVPQESTLVSTPTTVLNLGKFASALLDSRPVLLVGQPGSGKSCVVNDAARKLGAASSMITLHLNEQTDAKGLLGIYTANAGTFKWQPGILTKAVTEGRWVLIEDIDRAPQEVIGILLPLIEQGELALPSRKERLRTSPEFRLLATMRSNVNARGEQISGFASMLGARLWRKVDIDMLPMDEARSILNEKYPLLKNYVPSTIAAFQHLHDVVTTRSVLKGLRVRSVNLRDLLKWCARIVRRLREQGIVTTEGAITEETTDHIFMDAIECFIRYLPDPFVRADISAVIAQELHLSPQRVNFILHERLPEINESEALLGVGKEVLRKTSDRSVKDTTFSWTRHASRLIETCAAGVQMGEPLLLVGETGIGKTTAIQYLAKKLGKNLIVINLSQQSESSDILGGFKPVTTRSIALPMMEEFEDLFDKTFSAKRNQKFLASITASARKQNYQRLAVLWEEALKMAENNLDIQSSVHHGNEPQKPAKRRRIEGTKYEVLRSRWSAFASQLSNLRAIISKRSNKFAFAFVEGKVIQAMRNGDWVLLDEINLAAPDTLESILGLLNYGDDGPPTALLADSAQTEKVVGHKDFRIFAAMNPATDSGKRDLASGIRSRFTEIYVDAPDRDLADLLILIETYIGDLTVSDKRLASDLAQLYLAVQDMNDRRHLTDGAGNIPHFSIRTLVRTLLYVRRHVGVYGLRRALYEGFSMSFLTMLSKESEVALVPLLDKFLLASQKNARSLLRQAPRPPTDGSQYVQFRHYWVSKGPLEPLKEQHYIITPFVERNLLNLARAVSMKTYPILLQGPTSAGKTSMIEYLAKISGHKFVRINNHEHTDLQEYLGSYMSDQEGRLHYQEGILVQALREGHWVVLDELNLAPTDVLEALNRLLDDNRELFIPETQETVKPHRDFMLFATQNPAGVYGGRKHLSRAFRNRFLELHFDDIPEDELEFILRERAQIAPSFCAKIVAVYKKLTIMRQSARLFEQRNSFATLRDLFRWALRKADDREQLAMHGFMLLAERVRDPAEKHVVKSIIEEVMKVTIDESKLYSMDALPKLPAEPPSSIVWTSATIRLAVLILRAIENNEPVLLIGETGAGKTQVFQTVSHMLGKALHIVNAHVNLETGDLIGAQRPIRNRAAIEERLRDDIQNLLRLSEHHDLAEESSLDILTREFSKRNDLGEFAHEVDLANRVQSNMVRRHALFEWTDGSLVSAMKAGEHFLLDEISLADDSVLERLNSVLEPSRTILLAEKGADKASVTASPGFQFFATMNPGGDYGKRELSAALRNRLTEIWVPALNDQDIIPILQRRLSLIDPSVPEMMLLFSKWFKQSFSRSSETRVSLRELLSWAEFVMANKSLALSVALAHGAAMVYVDGLGANPATSMTVPAENLPIARQQCLAKLSDILKIDAMKILTATPEVVYGKDSLIVGQFGLSCMVDAVRDPEFAFEAPTTCRNAMKVVRALQVDKPILLEGDPGVGKTTLIAALARVTGRNLTRINLSEQTDLMDLFGSDVPLEGEAAGSFAWRDGPFLRAMQAGEWVLLDEMNLASQSVLEGLNACLDHRKQVYITELDQTFYRHPGFLLFAAQNPHHQGGGRKGLPASFVNRFSVVYADALLEEDLTIIATQAYPQLPRAHIDAVITTTSQVVAQLKHNRRLGHSGGSWDINLRDISRWLQLCYRKDALIDPGKFTHLILSKRFRTQEQRDAINSIVKPFFRDPMEQSLFHNLDTVSVQVGLAFANRDADFYNLDSSSICMHSKFLPTYEALLHCIDRNWPAILVGSSGCGKSLCVRDLAALVGTELVEFALNGDTDSMDLVGGFEQIDPRRAIALHLEGMRKRLSAECTRLLEENADKAVIENLLDVLLLTQNTTEPHLLLQHLREVSESIPAYQNDVKTLERLNSISNAPERPSFAWTDGILVQAMESGSWVVLNNANLCNASVLDRLNSLMEPNGYLVINEQHKTDGSPRIVRAHPKFRVFLTMDSKYGELSKAMRNRCMEIFMEPIPQEQTRRISMPAYATESRLNRLRLLDQLPASEDGAYVQAYTRTALDHVSPLDIAVISTRPELYMSSSPPTTTLNSYQTLYVGHELQRKFLAVRQPALLSIMTAIAGTNVAIPDVQPVHALINEPLVALLSEDEQNSLASIGALADLHLDLVYINDAFNSVEDAASQKRASNLNVLERSVVAKRLPGEKNRSISGLAQFFSHTLRAVSHWIANVAATGVAEEKHVHTIVAEVVNFLRDMFHLTNARDLEAGAFQVYLHLGTVVAQQVLDFDPSMGSVLFSSLKVFDANWSLKFGRSLGRMWSLWRPWTPASAEELGILIRLKTLTTRFDTVMGRLQIPLDQLGKLRISLQASVDKSSFGRLDFDNVLSDLEKTIDSLEQTIDLESPSRSAVFEAQFEALAQYLDIAPHLSSDAVPKDIQSIISILAGRQTTLSLKEDQRVPAAVLEALASSSGQATGTDSLAITGNIALSIAETMSIFRDLPLSQISSSQVALTTLLRSFAHMPVVLSNNQLSSLKDSAWSLATNILHCHTDLLTSEALSILNNAVGWDSSEGTPIDTGVVSLLKPDVPSDNHFRHVSDQFILPALRVLIDDSSDLKQIGRSLCLISIALLHLLVPDRPFDPAMDLIVERARYAKRRLELSTKLRVILDFEADFTGQRTNLRSLRVEQELSKLGMEPPAPAVVRTDTADLHILQAEFDVIIQTVVLKSPETVLFSASSPAQRLEEARALQQNISKLVPRLVSCPVVYADLTQPIVWSLQCLSFAANLVCIDDSLNDEASKAIKTLCSQTPLMGGDHYSDDVSFDFKTAGTLDLRLLMLKKQLSQRKYLSAGNHHSSFSQSVMGTFESFYEQWKARLVADQDEQEKKSRYYEYRGADNEDETTEASELRQMFPTYDESGHSDIEGLPVDVPKQLAINLAHIQAQICDKDGSGSDLEEDLMLTLDAIAKLASSSLSKNQFVDPKLLLPVVFLKLDTAFQETRPTNTSVDVDFYHEANLPEVQALIELLQAIVSRFKYIRNTWPEHATPQDVLDCCSELLAFAKSDPLAKIITKVEKLHGFVNEWQTVASREYSVTELLQRVADLLIRWRKVELLSWPHLLEKERQNSKNEAFSWWFMTYEVLIAIPLQIIQDNGDIGAHCIDLADTLIKFLQTSSLGQFVPRMDMLQNFEILLDSLPVQNHGMQLLRMTLSNVVQHFARFRDHAKKTLEDGRLKSEREIKEQIQLASWKDTNVTALRDSARRSHHKLFRIVRKYRTFLARPFEIPTNLVPEHTEEHEIPSLRDVDASKENDVIRLESQLRDSFEDWVAKPERLRKPFSASQSMKRLYHSVSQGLEPHSVVRSFSEMLVASISALRKETPRTLTEDNKDYVQHLKSRKRKLLTDTIRAVRQMGISRNINTEELDRQRSLSTILATTPARDLGLAQDWFHALLDILPSVHHASQEYSDDLTGSEVGRSVGSIQGLLSLLRGQRAILVPALSDLKDLSHIQSQLRQLQTSTSDKIYRMTPTEIHLQTSTPAQLKQLDSIINLGCRVLEIQSRHSGVEFRGIQEGLRKHQAALLKQIQFLDNLPSLPWPFSNKHMAGAYHASQAAIQAFRADVAQWSMDEPRLSYLLDQIRSWSGSALTNTAPETDDMSPSSIFDIDDSITSAADSIFVALQRLSAIPIPDTQDEQEAGWLVKADRHIHASIKELHIGTIVSKLEATLDKLTRCESSSGTDLNTAVMLMNVLQPIFEQYHSICEHVLRRYSALHNEVCEMSYILAKALTQVTTEGFCSPAEPGGGEDQSGKVESGTGLGEGEGAEDISKDVADDEDLSEFAQQQNEKEGEEEIDAAEDAVDMGAEDLEGNMDDSGEAKEPESGDEQSGQEEEEIDEEVGDVDNLDPSAVDEKMWDGLGKEDEKELQNDEAEGQADQDDAAAAQEKQREAAEQEGQQDAAGSDEDEASSADEEGEAVGREELDQTDPHLQEEQAMELPEEMQLDGEKAGDESSISDDDFDKLSDVEEPEPEHDNELSQSGEIETADPETEDVDSADPDEPEAAEANAADEDEVMEEPTAEDDKQDEDHLQRQDDEAQGEDANTAESGAGGEVDERQDRSNGDQTMADALESLSQDAEEQQQQGVDEPNVGKEQGTGRRDVVQEEAQQGEAPSEQQIDAFKKLGDVLERWHRQQREIMQATEDPDPASGQIHDEDMADAEFEHLRDEEDVADTQALGSATKDQARALDQTQALEDQHMTATEDNPPADIDEMEQPAAEDNILDADSMPPDAQNTTSDQQTAAGAFIPDLNTLQPSQIDAGEVNDEAVLEQIPDLSTISLDSADLPALTEPEQASRLWQHYSSVTHSLSLGLTEQLRLILSPTLASKLRGDFRTGKRLNIKRIIPYIASNYKRDKIWLRRSVPSKRNYQILLAVDDSKSMAESGSGFLALETVALLCKSLSMLEVGEISVVNFGNEEHIRVAHPFGTPFTNDAGPKVFQNFSYAQHGTNVRRLVEESISIFRDARHKNTGSNAADLWQLMMIISDGICEDHDGIRRLVRQAREERIMIVFVIVDAQLNENVASSIASQPAGAGGKPSTSILDLTSASFETDPLNDGEMKLKIKRYLDGFPFPYYLIVRDVRELPAVLSTALKGWFQEVVESA